MLYCLSYWGGIVSCSEYLGWVFSLAIFLERVLFSIMLAYTFDSTELLSLVLIGLPPPFLPH